MRSTKQRGNCKGLQVLKGVIRLSAIASLHVAGFLATFPKSAQALDQFDNSSIQFDVDTVVEFQFVASQGAYKSTFGVINLDTGEKTPLLTEVKSSDNPQDVTTPTDYTRSLSKPDFVGTPGNTVPQPLPEFEFKANTRYAFYLESTYNGRPDGILYSTDTQNPGSNQQAKFQGDISALQNGGVVIRWDDTGSLLVPPSQQDRDFNDFIVRAGGHLACPYAANVSGKLQSEGSYEPGKNVKCTGK